MDFPRRTFLQLAAGAAALASPGARAQSYPTRPIRLVVPFPPGGAYDTLGRPLAERLKAVLGTVIVENIGGGGSSLGAAQVAHAAPDGYTVLLGGTLPHVNEALLKSKPLYDPVRDLEPISNVANNSLGIAVHPSVPVHNLTELVAYAKANPGKLSYGHVGIGSLNHLGGEMFKSLTGTSEIVQVPYRGAGPATSDLISGQIPMAVIAVTAQAIELHRSGKLRILAVTSNKRLAAAPELPTATEEGVPLITTNALGLLAPAGTPKDVIERLAQATHAALADPAFVQKLTDLGFDPDPNSSPEVFRHTLQDDVAHWTPIIQSLGLKID
jgi:tripartite-type tricarboxylate transporter receptor subunit TctC